MEDFAVGASVVGVPAEGMNTGGIVGAPVVLLLSLGPTERGFLKRGFAIWALVRTSTSLVSAEASGL